MAVDLLILGAGWTSTFLIPLCKERGVVYAATSRSGAGDTIKFEFDQNSTDDEGFRVLPDARTVLISFPITVKGASERLLKLYLGTRSESSVRNGGEVGFVQLGATSIWGEKGSKAPAPNKWYDRHSPIIHDQRAEAEDELLRLSRKAKGLEVQTTQTTVLDLAGLWGGERSMKKWVGRVAPTKEILKNKGSIHMIHGIDVARAILAVHAKWDKADGQRWLLTDGRVYDWWELASGWGSGQTDNASPDEDQAHGPQPRWVRELMREEGVRALPRDPETLGRALDSREFWEEFGLMPSKGRLEG